jgi:hypothetical protein
MGELQDVFARFGSTTFVDAVLAITLVEALALWAWSRWRGGIDFDALAPSLASGLMLMAALRLAVGGAASPWIALLVALSGVCHVWDLRRRWSRTHPASARTPPMAVSRAAPLSPP